MLYMQQANKFYREINSLTLSEFKIKSGDLEKNVEEKLGLALPYMEMALTLEPKNPDVLRSLMVYYDRLAMNAKKVDIESKMKALGINF